MSLYAIIDDTDPGLVYTGEWQVLTDPVNPRAPEYNGTTHVTNDPTATISYQFYGSMLSAFGTIDTPSTKGYPNASFTITPNGVPLTHFNQNGNLPTFPEPNVPTTHVQLFTSDRLVTGNYTMTITADGARQGGPAFYFDFLTVLLPDSMDTVVEKAIVDDADTQWVFKGPWSTVNRPGNYLYTVHESHNPGMSITLPFQGTNIVVYGTLVGAYSNTKPLGYFQIDNADNHTVLASDIPNEATLNDGTLALRNQQIFSASGLTPGQHTLTIVVPSNPSTPSSAAAPSNPPWFIDYAVYGPASPNFSYASVPTFTLSDASSPSSSTSSLSPPSTSPPTGAIAGGIIGGVILVIAIAAAFLLSRRKRRRKVTQEAAVGEVFPLDSPTVTPYKTLESSPNLSLVGRMPSMHKAAQRGGRQNVRRESSALDESPVGGSETTGSFSPRRSGIRDARSRTTGSGTGSSSVSEVEPKRSNQRRARREVDGGVRLATASDNDGDIEEVLPPSYAQYA